MSDSQQRHSWATAAIPTALAIAVLISVALVFYLASPCQGEYRWKIGGSEYFFFECIGPPVPSPQAGCNPSHLGNESILLHYSQNNVELATDAKRLLEGAGAQVTPVQKQETGPYHDYVVYTWEGGRPKLARAVKQCLSNLRAEWRIDRSTEWMDASWSREYNAIVYLVEQ